MMGGTRDNGITHVTAGAPEDGSVIMCMNCGQVSIMGAGEIRKATADDVASFDRDTVSALLDMDRRRRALPRGDLRQREARA